MNLLPNNSSSTCLFITVDVLCLCWACPAEEGTSYPVEVCGECSFLGWDNRHAGVPGIETSHPLMCTHAPLGMHMCTCVKCRHISVQN
jgi:hypothetical protein